VGSVITFVAGGGTSFPTRHLDPERSEGEGPHAMGSVITFVAERGTSCNVHAKHELPPALRYACAVRDDGRTTNLT
jgi:hypothetical protein